ncbi:L,D-transpeptidase [Microvirga aerilata]|jgi:lipoprotein-anchoring transpeptidase ErfK/SrfK|uniref:L,D-transpeptidase n=1 Tax=Microvirga aerilata TaxID=670292 RepID=A0A936ZDH9_9HYPH|nr:L,D-transpeptidase [Microvirga aerilata]MBL0402819.1 L,D-transpeptidase [Microvirga aerilata]
MFAAPVSSLSSLRKAIRFLVLLLPVALAACVSTQTPPQQAMRRIDPAYAAMYGPRLDEPHPLPATDISEVDPRFLRREVAYYGREEPGTIVVDTTARYLYLVREGGRAIRYGIGVGKEGLAWSGRARVGRKAAWPRWTPTPAMIRREPERNAKWAGGMEGGLDNPLGARALYLYDNGVDTLYRIHGTTEPWSIGQSVSSGCIRMFNQDIIDLHSRVPVGSPVVVLRGQRLFDVEDEVRVSSAE